MLFLILLLVLLTQDFFKVVTFVMFLLLLLYFSMLISYRRFIHTRLQEMTFNKVVNDPKKHFDNVYINNFDLIHHKSRGDPLEFSEKFYKTISVSQVSRIDYPKSYQFVAAAIKSERDDVFLEKDVIKRHFKNENIELKLMKQNIFLSSMKKRAFFRKKGKCNFLKFNS